jgi:hypothetical protein
LADPVQGKPKSRACLPAVKRGAAGSLALDHNPAHGGGDAFLVRRDAGA